MRALLILISLILFSCTSYAPKGLAGGFVETQLNATTWKINVNGNGFTSNTRVDDYALLRASELTIENGYKYFLVTSSSQDVKKNKVKLSDGTSRTTGTINGGLISATTTDTPARYSNVSKYRSELIFTMVDSNRVSEDMIAYDAQLIYDSLTEKYNIE